MDPLSIIVTALALGAAAGLKDTAENAIKDAYAALKKLIQDRYTKVDVSVIEANPASPARREVLADDLSKAQADKDEEVLAQAKVLVEAVRRCDPEAAQTIGVNLKDIQGASLTIQEVDAAGEKAMGVKVEHADIAGDIKISSVRAHETAKQTGVTRPKKSKKTADGKSDPKN